MLKKIALTAAVAAASLIAAANSYKVQILQDTTLAGKPIKAGDYKIVLDGNNAILKHGKDVVTVPAHTEQAQVKYNNTQVKYVNNAIEEIHVGGSTTRIVFGEAPASSGGGTR